MSILVTDKTFQDMKQIKCSLHNDNMFSSPQSFHQY